MPTRILLKNEQAPLKTMTPPLRYVIETKERHAPLWYLERFQTGGQSHTFRDAHARKRALEAMHNNFVYRVVPDQMKLEEPYGQ